MNKLRVSRKNVLPENHRYGGIKGISWSDILAIESNVEKWIDGYRLPESEAFKFGQSVHERIEHGLIEAPRGCHPETQLSALVDDEFYLLGKPDDFDGKEIVDEYKTGAKLWTRKQAQDHNQYDIYAYLIWKNGYPHPKHARLTSFETAWSEDAESLYLTGEKVTHIVLLNLTRTMRAVARAKLAYKKVKDALKAREIKQQTNNKNV